LRQAARGLIAGALGAALLTACSAKGHRAQLDRRAYDIIEEKQAAALQRTESFSVESPAETLRRRLLLGQDLPYAGPASLGSDYLPVPERWPEAREQELPSSAEDPTAAANLPPLTLSDALQIAAQNSREYQSEKEDVFRSALELDLERDQFRTTFAGLLSGSYQLNRNGLADSDGVVSESWNVNARGDAAQLLKSGLGLTLSLGWNLLRLLEPSRFTSRSLFGDASISLPLLRGAGRHVITESLTQAERDVIYAIYQFERFKRSFAVRVAAQYLEALQRSDQVRNAAENYRGLIASTRRARRLLDAGDLPSIQVDQAIQDELSARNRWVSALEAQVAALDVFKDLLGIPTDAAIELDRDELAKVATLSQRLIAGQATLSDEGEIPPADAPIELKKPSVENAGPYEIPAELATRVALANRLDLQIAQDQVRDAQRRVILAADRLRPELTLLGRARYEADRLSEVSFDHGAYDVFLNLDLPLERTAEAVAYRQSLLNLEEAVRSVQALEDAIKTGVRERLRNLREARESLQIQALSVELARRRVRGADLNLQAGRVEIRDLLEAQEDLLSAQNALTAAAVNYRLAELELQRDLDVLEVGPDGLWREFNPESLADELEAN
jgi:outer membrane protein TolC